MGPCAGVWSGGVTNRHDRLSMQRPLNSVDSDVGGVAADSYRINVSLLFAGLVGFLVINQV